MPTTRLRPRRQRLLALLAGVAVTALLAGGCGDDADGDAAGAPIDPGDVWPTGLAGELVGGGQIDANDLEGRDLVLWFWAPW